MLPPIFIVIYLYNLSVVCIIQYDIVIQCNLVSIPPPFYHYSYYEDTCFHPPSLLSLPMLTLFLTPLLALLVFVVKKL